MMSSTKTSNRRVSGFAFITVIVAVLVALLAVHGGFSDFAGGLAGTALSAAALVELLLNGTWRSSTTRSANSIAGPLLLAAIGAAACMSAFAHGITLSMVASSCPWFSAAAAAMMVAFLPDKERDTLLDVLCWVGVVSAFVAIALTLAMGAPSTGVGLARLQFPFQYANSAGIWYAAVSVLALFSQKRALRYLAFVPVCAMLLTQSVGAIGTYTLGFCAASAISAKSGHLHSRDRWVPVATSVALVCLSCAGATAFAPSRIMQASQTFTERIVQIADGMRMLFANPLLGVGPDVWSLTYPFMQSAQYQANAIHCGYLQIALDSGVIGLAAFIAYAIHGVRGTLKASQPVRAIAICMVLLHIAFDFDLEFSALLLFFVIICESSQGTESRNAVGKIRKNPALQMKAACVIVVCFCLLGCSMGALGAHAVQVAHDAGIAGNAEAVLEVAESTPAAQADASIQTSVYAALQQLGNADEIERHLDDYGVRSAEQAVLAASGLFRAGRIERASLVLVSELEREPYNIELFNQAAKLFEHFGIDESCAVRYRNAVDTASKSALQASEFWHLNQVSDLPYGCVA